LPLWIEISKPYKDKHSVSASQYFKSPPHLMFYKSPTLMSVALGGFKGQVCPLPSKWASARFDVYN
jgi:hypothetical protein